MSVVSMAAAAGTGGRIEQIATTFGVDWPHLIAQTISFGIVCACLYVLAYRPVLRMLDTRRGQIAQGLANAAQVQAELDRTTSARDAVLQQANVEAARIVEEARAAAARVQAQETTKAIAAAEDIAVKAREDTARDRDRMLRELKSEIGRLVVKTTAIVSGKVLTAEDQRRLVEETTRQLAS
jgi:F-type H+-transporting ATPase subunit b